MSYFADDLQAAILRRLEAVLEVNSGPLKRIEIASFFDVAEMQGLFERYQTIAPGGLLSRPLLDFATLQPPIGRTQQRPRAICNYSFIAMTTDKSGSVARNSFDSEITQRVMEALQDYQFLESEFTTGWAFDPIAFINSTPVDLPEFFARVFTFSARARTHC